MFSHNYILQEFERDQSVVFLFTAQGISHSAFCNMYVIIVLGILDSYIMLTLDGFIGRS